MIGAVTEITATGMLCYGLGMLSDRFENRRSDFK